MLAYLTSARDRRRRLRARRRGAADGAGVRDAADAGRAGLTLQDFDFYEIHEAFASQVLATLKAWEDPIFCKERLGLDAPLGAIDRDRLNVTGSSLAAGHPFAATGGRIVATLAKLLAEKGSGPGRDLDLRRRRPGRHGDPGATDHGALARATAALTR